MFSLKDQKLTNTSNFLSPGFHKNMELKKVSTETASNGTNVIVFEFEGVAGKYTHKEFEMDRTHDKYNPDMEQYQFNRLGHILGAFIPENKVMAIEDSMRGDTAVEWWNLAIATLGQSYLGVKCELKITHDNYSGFAKFPLFPNFISTDLNQAKLVVNKKYDIMETPKDKPDTEKDMQTPVTTTTRTEDLDF